MSSFARYSLLFVGQAKSMAKVKVETIARMMMARQYVETASDPKLAFSPPPQQPAYKRSRRCRRPAQLCRNLTLVLIYNNTSRWWQKPCQHSSFPMTIGRQAGRQARELLVYVKHALGRLHLMEPILRVGSINDTLNMILVRCGRTVGARRAQLKGGRAGGDGGGGYRSQAPLSQVHGHLSMLLGR